VEKNVWERVKEGDEPMVDLVWQEVGVLLSSGGRARAPGGIGS
jgi:hypothetical protein